MIVDVPVEPPVCARCGKQVCPCMASVPEEKRICGACRQAHRREKAKASEAARP